MKVKDMKKVMDFMVEYNHSAFDKIRQWHLTEKSLVVILHSGYKKRFKLEDVLNSNLKGCDLV